MPPQRTGAATKPQARDQDRQDLATGAQHKTVPCSVGRQCHARYAPSHLYRAAFRRGADSAQAPRDAGARGSPQLVQGRLMRVRIAALAIFMLLATADVQARVSIVVDKNSQTMTVAVDGVERYQWPVSTGNPSHETPNGQFRTFRMEEDHYSKEFDDAPMPHSIFFTKSGHAIHGTDSVDRLGSPASHGCIRLLRENASTLFALVQSEGVLNTTVELSGSSKVALANNPRSPSRAATAPREIPCADAASSNPAEQPQGAARAAGQQAQPQRTDDGYTDPIGRRSAGQHDLAPRGHRPAGNTKSRSSPDRQTRSFFSFLD